MIEQWFMATDYYRPEIVKVEVVKRTAKTITTLFYHGGLPHEEKSAIESCRKAHFAAWEGAHAWLMERADINLRSARQRLATAQSRHGNVKGMKPPAA